MATKKLPWFDRFIFFFNSVFAFLLLFSYALPFVSPKYIPFVSILNFGIPLLLLLNAIFLLYWLLRIKKQLFLSALVLLVGYSHISSLYVFSNENENTKQGFKLMSYNVRHFNMFKWIPDANVVDEIEAFIQVENPDFIAFQDYMSNSDFDIQTLYPYRYVNEKGKSTNLTTAFYSKYPILSKQDIPFKNSGNGAMYVDIKLPNDTLRIFNLHLESLKIKPDVAELKNEDTKLLIHRVGNAFKKQAEQVEIILPYIENSPYPNIVVGDFNNTAFSYVYRELKSKQMQDAFKEKGVGFGQTFVFDFIPIRIDHALVDKRLEVMSYISYEVEHSDHYPLLVAFKGK